MKQNRPEPVNLLALKPRRNLQWETNERGQVVLLVPKFQNRFVRRWFVPLLAKPNFRVRLDTFGSFVWNLCDGETTVADISERLKGAFGESAEPVHERVRTFLSRLEKDEFLLIEYTNASVLAVVF